MGESRRRKTLHPSLYGTPECPGAGVRSTPPTVAVRWLTKGHWLTKYDDATKQIVPTDYVAQPPYKVGRNAAKRTKRERAKAARLQALRLRAQRRRAVKVWARRCQQDPSLIAEGP